MRLIILTLTLTITLLSGKGQVTSKPGHQFQFSQVGWKVKVPSDFTIMDSAQAAAADDKAAKTLISFSKGQYNFFSSTITPYNPERDGDWNDINSKQKM